jgi:hypothetical protein
MPAAGRGDAPAATGHFGSKHAGRSDVRIAGGAGARRRGGRRWQAEAGPGHPHPPVPARAGTGRERTCHACPPECRRGRRRRGTARRGELTLAGTPAAGAGGQYGIALTARDAAGSGAQLLTVTVDQAPQFTSHPAISASTAAASSTAVTITGYPAAVITGAGTLPAGMVLAALPGGTAVIYGTPRITGPRETRQITLTAVNAAGTARETISLSVSNPAYVPPAPPVMMAPAPVMSAPPVMMPPGGASMG